MLESSTQKETALVFRHWMLKAQTGDESLFQKLNKNKSENVSFGDNSKGVIRGIGTIGNNSHTQINNVLLIKNLKYNLLSISQLCDKGYSLF